MSGPAQVWQQAAEKWNEVAAQIGDADWNKQATCPEWTVRELVDHTMHWQAMGGGALGAQCSPEDDWATVQAALAETLGDPANLEGNAEAFGGMPKQGVAGMFTADILIHTWDLAQSIGADATLPAEAVEATLMGLQRLPEQMLRTETMFGPAVEVADDASAQDKLIAFTGRQP